MSGRVKGKVAVVTGGGQSIGLAIVERLCEEGAHVIVGEVNESQCRETQETLRAKGFSCLYVQTDISNEESVKNLMSKAEEFGGNKGIDILVNNAAMFVFGKVDSVSSEDWDRILSVNIKGTAFCSKHAIPAMRKAGGGSIVCIGSISSFIAQDSFVPYNTSKGAIMQMVRCMAHDHGPENIRVNAVCPGNINTPATANHAKSVGMSLEALQEQMVQGHFIKRLGTTRDVANAVLFLASDEATFVTGTSLLVDGGYTAQ